MITCSETGKELSQQEKIFAATRIGDNEAFPLSEGALGRLPKKCRTSMRHRYRTGGINIHIASIDGTNGDTRIVVNRDDGFVFSVPGYEFLSRMPKTATQFNFPGR